MPPNKPAERVGLEVRVLMLRAGATQAELAALLGMSQAAVSRRLAGTVPFDVTELSLIAGRLGVEPAELLAAA
jgi:transcriptional regulator with XRE-family HTH domain